jgi:hypothetical protein
MAMTLRSIAVTTLRTIFVVVLTTACAFVTLSHAQPGGAEPVYAGKEPVAVACSPGAKTTVRVMPGISEVQTQTKGCICHDSADALLQMITILHTRGNPNLPVENQTVSMGQNESYTKTFACLRIEDVQKFLNELKATR